MRESCGNPVAKVIAGIYLTHPARILSRLGGGGMAASAKATEGARWLLSAARDPLSQNDGGVAAFYNTGLA